MNRLHRWYCGSASWRTSLERLVPWALADAVLGEHLLDLGPGSGLAMPLLASRTPRVTAIDLDSSALAAVRRSPSLSLVRGDATSLPFASGTFSAVLAFTMLHHIPTRELQQQLFRDVLRTLRPGGVFVGLDARVSLGLRLFHLGDIWFPLSPDEAGPRLASVGFEEIEIECRPRFFRFCARAPRATDMERERQSSQLQARFAPSPTGRHPLAIGTP